MVAVIMRKIRGRRTSDIFLLGLVRNERREHLWSVVDLFSLALRDPGERRLGHLLNDRSGANRVAKRFCYSAIVQDESPSLVSLTVRGGLQTGECVEADS